MEAPLAKKDSFSNRGGESVAGALHALNLGREKIQGQGSRAVRGTVLGGSGGKKKVRSESGGNQERKTVQCLRKEGIEQPQNFSKRPNHRDMARIEGACVPQRGERGTGTQEPSTESAKEVPCNRGPTNGDGEKGPQADRGKQPGWTEIHPLSVGEIGEFKKDAESSEEVKGHERV